MRFFGISQHVSGMPDIRGILSSIAPGTHTLDDLTLSRHSWVMHRRPDSAPMLDGEEWRETIRNRRWKEFHARWRERLEEYDAFICFHPPVFAYLYQHFDKPVICQVSIRYEYPYDDDPQRWSEFNDFLRDGVDRGKVILCANNPYDAAYTELFVGRPVKYVPSLCEYTQARWRPERATVAYYSAHRVAELEDGPFAHKSRALPPGHTWNDVAAFRAIAHFPYNVSTMSIIEQYAMGVPMFFPALDYAVTLYEHGARLFAQNSWAGTAGHPPGSVITPPSGFPEGHDPNDYADLESLRYWLRYADYYDESSMPGLTYFSSIEELYDLANRADADYEEMHARICASFPARRKRAFDGWSEMIGEMR